MTTASKHEPAAWRLDRLASPIGPLSLVVDPQGSVLAVAFEGGEARALRLLRLRRGAATIVEAPAPERVRTAFIRYFAGDIEALDGLECAASGTPFQQGVWRSLRTIAAGQTLSYGALAARIGAPRAVRAVGLANGANPTPLIAPCHRVIGADGSLTGFGGGLDRKRWLLRHEGARFVDRSAA